MRDQDRPRAEQTDARRVGRKVDFAKDVRPRLRKSVVARELVVHERGPTLEEVEEVALLREGHVVDAELELLQHRGTQRLSPSREHLRVLFGLAQELRVEE